MLTCISCDALQLHRHVPDFLRGAVFLEKRDQLFFLLQRFGERHAHLKRDEFRHSVRQAIGLSLHPRHIPHDRFGRHGAKGDDLRHRLTPIGLSDIVDHLVATLHAKIDIKIRHGHPLRIQETLKEQVIFNRVQVRNAQGISH